MAERIFKIPNTPAKMEYGRFVGFYTSREMDAMITLVGISRGVSRSVLLRQIVEEWLEENHPTNDELISTIVKHAYLTWEVDNKLPGREGEVITLFEGRLKEDLLSRNMPEEFVNEIVEKFREYVMQH